MAEIDIRQHVDVPTHIKFADVGSTYKGTHLYRTKENIDFPVWIDGDNSCQGAMIGIGDKEDALNLIKALSKAIELGWFDK